MQTKEDALALVEFSERLLGAAAGIKKGVLQVAADAEWRATAPVGLAGWQDLLLLGSLAESCTTQVEERGPLVSALAGGAPRLRDQNLVDLLQDVSDMARRSAWLLRQALDRFLAQDPGTSKALIQQACLVRGLYQHVYYDSLDYAAACPGSIEEVGMILSAASNLECAARFVICVCEQTTRAAAGEGAATGFPSVLPLSVRGSAAVYAESCGD